MDMTGLLDGRQTVQDNPDDSTELDLVERIYFQGMRKATVGYGVKAVITWHKI